MLAIYKRELSYYS